MRLVRKFCILQSTSYAWWEYKTLSSRFIGIKYSDISLRGIMYPFDSRLQRLFRFQLLCQELARFVELIETTVQTHIVECQCNVIRQQLQSEKVLPTICTW